MQWFVDMVTSRYFLAPFFGWFLAQLMKIPFNLLIHKELDWRQFFAAGGMPSSHTALLTSLCVMIAFQKGTGSVEFAICLAVTVIVMYDAAGVRRETGRQGKAINEILGSFIMEGRPISDEEMKEIVGHTPLEVFAGALLGILCAALLLWIYP